MSIFADYRIEVKEQNPTETSIFCQVKVTDEDKSSINFGNMYFVCNLNRQITQYFSWLEDYKKQLNDLGYKF